MKLDPVLATPAHNTASRPRRKVSIKIALIGLTLLVVGLVIGSFLAWYLQQSSSLLPASVVRQVSTFTPYFYSDQVPAGYSFSAESITVDGDLLIIPLTKSGDTVVMTQQSMPANLSEDEFLRDGTRVEGTVSPAIVGKVQGRTVGSMVASSTGTLVLLNAPGTVSEDDISALLRGLRPL